MKSVSIALTYEALNGIEVCTSDIKNAYLHPTSCSKEYIVCGPEFGIENVGKYALVCQAVYGGKSSGKDFRNYLRSCKRHLYFSSHPSNPDVWIRPAKHSNDTYYYDFILLYTDNTLVISANTEQVLYKKPGRYFELKEKSIGPLNIYLGGSTRQV